MIVPAAGGEHVIAVQQVHGLLRGGGTVQHQTNGQRREDGLLAGLLDGRFAVQRQYRNGNAFFVHAVQTDERSGQHGDLLGKAGIRLVGRNVAQGRKGHRFIAVFGGAVDQKRRGVDLEVIVPAHQDLLITVRNAEGAASVIRGRHVDGQKRDGFLQDGVQHILIAGNTIGDKTVKVVRILDIHPVEVVVFVVGHFFQALNGADAGKIKCRKPADCKEHQNQKYQQNALENLFHGNPSFDLIISRQKGGTQFGKTDRNFQQSL